MSFKAPARRGFFLVLVPLGLAVAPLFCVASWSAAYGIAVAAACATALAAAALVARHCRRVGGTTPARRALLVIGAVAAALLAAEGVCRWLFPDSFATYRIWGQDRSWLLLFETAADHRWQGHGAWYTSDRRGFRTHVRRPVWASEPPAASPRVFVLGGSSAFGYGLQNDETWAHLLEARLAAASPGTLVVNAANNGHSSLQSALRLLVRVLPERPTHVLYYEAINDISETGTALDIMQQHAEIVFAPSLSAYLWQHRHDHNPYARTVLWHLVTKRLQGIRPKPRTAPLDEAAVARIGAAGDLFARHVTTMADMCRRAGTTLVCCTYLCDPRRIDPYFAAAIRHLNERLRQVARTEALPLIDLEAQLPAEVPEDFFFEDNYHPAWRGAEWIAERVATGLQPLLVR